MDTYTYNFIHIHIMPLINIKCSEEVKKHSCVLTGNIVLQLDLGSLEISNLFIDFLLRF